jgi:hypothetical protein
VLDERLGQRFSSREPRVRVRHAAHCSAMSAGRGGTMSAFSRPASSSTHDGSLEMDAHGL